MQSARIAPIRTPTKDLGAGRNVRQSTMIEALLFLLACQLVGEALVHGLALQLPGPVLGMGLLFLNLLWRGRGTPSPERPEIPGELGEVSDRLLQNLSLLFVPAAVGIIQHLGRLREFGLQIAAVLVVSTLATLMVTALIFNARAGRSPPKPDAPPGRPGGARSATGAS
jgi:holin-like protein